MSNKTELQVNNAALEYVQSIVEGLPNALPVTGGTMTGALILHADPVGNLQAATKQYVDSAIAQVTVSLATVG